MKRTRIVLGLFRKPRSSRRGKRAFTLIELLIVIAIILILIAIALPNFLEAQIRARVARVNSDLRSIGIALEAYFLDFGAYPGESEPDMANQDHSERGLLRLTTPISYMSEVPQDPFPSLDLDLGEIAFYTGGGCQDPEIISIGLANAGPISGVWSKGPSRGGNLPDATHPNYKDPGQRISTYSATNGTKSVGALFHFAGEGAWWGIDTVGPSGVFNLCNRAKLKDPSLRQNPLRVDDQFYLGTRPPNSYQ